MPSLVSEGRHFLILKQLSKVFLFFLCVISVQFSCENFIRPQVTYILLWELHVYKYVPS